MIMRDGPLPFQAVIRSTGAYLPSRRMTNEALTLAFGLETTDEWIRSRTGIEARHMAAPDEYTSTMATFAARDALARAQCDASSIDWVIVATTTPDYSFPSTAACVQAALGTAPGAAFDLQAVCAGFVYGLSIATHAIMAGAAKRVLLIGAETMSRLVDWKDRRTCVLFGDGAGAVILEAMPATPGTAQGILHTTLHADGSLLPLLHVPEGISRTQTVGTLEMQGQEVFRHAVLKMSAAIETVLQQANMTPDQVDWVVPHQANQRIMDAIARKLDIAPERVISSVKEHANTSAASIPLALHDAMCAGKLQKGQHLVFAALGGGMCWGAALLRWEIDPYPL